MAQATNRSGDAKNQCLEEVKQGDTDTKMVGPASASFEAVPMNDLNVKPLSPTTVKYKGIMQNDGSKTDLGVGKPSEIEQFSNKVKQPQKKLSDKDAKVVTLEIELAKAKQRESSLEIELAKAKQRESSLDRELARTKQNEASLADAFEQIKRALAANNVQISDLVRRNTAKDEEILSMTRQLQELEGQNKKLSEELEIKKEEVEVRKKQLARCFNQLEDLRCRLEEAERTIESKQRRMEEKDAELQEKERVICLLQTSPSSLIRDMAEENDLLQREVPMLTDTIQALKRRISSLEVQNRVLVEKLRVERMEREDLRRLVERALGGLQVVDPNLHNAEEANNSL